MEHEAYIFNAGLNPKYQTSWGFLEPPPLSFMELLYPQPLIKDQLEKCRNAKVWTDAETRRPHNPYTDIFSYNINDYLYSDLVFNKIEELEPGVHDIFPVLIVDKETHEVKCESYHYLHLTNYVECVDEAASKMHPETRDDDGRVIRSKWPWGSVREARVTLFKDAIEGRHLWRDPRYNSISFCSGEFKRWLEKNKIFAYEFHPCLTE
jgi:hypothetical protein